MDPFHVFLSAVLSGVIIAKCYVESSLAAVYIRELPSFVTGAFLWGLKGSCDFNGSYCAYGELTREVFSQYSKAQFDVFVFSLILSVFAVFERAIDMFSQVERILCAEDIGIALKPFAASHRNTM